MEDPLVLPTWESASKIALILASAEENLHKRALAKTQEEKEKDGESMGQNNNQNNQQKAGHSAPIDSDFSELRATVNQARTKLVPFISHPVHGEVAFDLCLNGIRQVLDQILKLLDGIESYTAVNHTTNSAQEGEWFQRKIKLYRQDFALKQRLDQFETLFPHDLGPSKGAAMIVDPDARDFWKTAFGDRLLLVPWATFFQRLQDQMDEDYTKDEACLRAFIDFTNDGFVTPYEFNVYMLWFGPFHGCCKRMIKPFRAGLLSGFVPAIEATSVLDGKPPGTYMIRFSKTQLGAFAVAFVDGRGRTKHCLLYSVQPAGVTLKQPPQVYRSLLNFTDAHTSKLKFPVGLCSPLPTITTTPSKDTSTLTTNTTVTPTASPFSQQKKRPSSRQPQHQPQQQLHPDGAPSSSSSSSLQATPGRQRSTSSTSSTTTKSSSQSSTPQSGSPVGSPATSSNRASSPKPSRRNLDDDYVDSDKEDVCSVCLDAPPQTCFLECGHLTCCKECSTKVKDCPICRQRITRVINIYKS